MEYKSKNDSIIIFLILLTIFFILINCEKDYSPMSKLYEPAPPTTSHKFTWEVFEFGTIGSYLRDVFIINPDNIWAVGVIFPDSVNKYNVVHWNGNYWEMKKMLADARKVFPGSTGADSTFSEGQTVYAFGPNEIIVFAGTIQYFNGLEWQQFKGDLRIRESWGTSSNDIYFCGLEGVLFNFDGNRINRLNSKTKGNITDIFGIKDNLYNNINIYYTVMNLAYPDSNKIFQITPLNNVAQFTWRSDKLVKSIWFNMNNKIYACGSGVWRFEMNKWNKISEIPAIFTRKVRANHENDLFVVGDFGLICHFNGFDWHIYPRLIPNSALLSVDVKDDLVVIVGTDGTHAYIIKGTRN